MLACEERNRANRWRGRWEDSCQKKEWPLAIGDETATSQPRLKSIRGATESADERRHNRSSTHFTQAYIPPDPCNKTIEPSRLSWVAVSWGILICVPLTAQDW